MEAAPRSRLLCEDVSPERERSRTDLLDSERIFRATFERAVVGIAHVGLDGRWLRVNQRLCDILGYSCEELAVRTWQDVTHPDDLADGLAHIRRVLAGEVGAYETDKRYVRKDGALVWAHLTVSLVRTPGGAPDYLISMAQDITERKRLERERARLLEQERAARLEAEATNAQLRAMQALTDTALSHLALDDLLRELLGRVTTVLGVDHVGISVLDADGRTLSLRAARGLGEEDVGRVQIPLGQGIAGRIVARRAPLIVEADELSDADYEGVPPILQETLRSLAGVPLLVVEDHAADRGGEGQGAAGRLVGVLGVGSVAPHRFSAADVQLLQRAADRVALAVDRARLYAAERDARTRAEAALARARASEAQATERAERLRAILETMADGVAVYDAEGRPIQVVNRAYRELYALERAPAGYEALPSIERARLLRVRDAATGAPLPFEDTPVGRALRGEVVTGPSADIRARAFDGRELEVNSSAAPLREPNGRVSGAVLVLRDMTERTRLAREREAALAQAEAALAWAQASERQAAERAERLNTILETMADAVAVYDAAGRPLQSNRAYRALYALDHAPAGYEALPLRERVRFLQVRDAATGAPLPLERMAIGRALRGEVVIGPSADVRVRAFDGREVEASNNAAPLRDGDGRVVGAVVVLRDMTERNRLQREREAAHADELAAREASRRMEAFLAVAAHDLRTPLTATLGFTALAERQFQRLVAAGQGASPAILSQVEAARARLEDAIQSGKRLARLLTLLFDMTAIRAGKLELRRAPCDLATLVREQVAALRVAAPDRALRLRAPAGSGPVPVEADADRIGQVVANYLTNALKYAPPDQPVDVSVAVEMARGGDGEEGRGWARVTVRDRGPGLPAAERARVWELFHRAPGVEAQGGGTASGAPGGSLGLGLYISKAIIEAHGGWVGVESVEGRGSTFWFTLPLASP